MDVLTAVRLGYMACTATGFVLVRKGSLVNEPVGVWSPKEGISTAVPDVKVTMSSIMSVYFFHVQLYKYMVNCT